MICSLRIRNLKLHSMPGLLTVLRLVSAKWLYCDVWLCIVKAGGMRVAKKSSEESGTPEKDTKRPEKPRYVSHFGSVHSKTPCESALLMAFFSSF